MAEVQYAKSFLGLLESRPIRYSSDYTADPRTLPAQSAYILPRMPKPYVKRARTSPSDPTSTSTSSTTLTITLKPLRGPSITITNQTPDSSIYELKSACASQAGYLPEKVKVLWERKPVSDSKTVKEVVGDVAVQGAQVEMGVMFMGQPGEKVGESVKEEAKAAPSPPPQEEEDVWHEAPVAPGQEHGKAVLDTKEFWDDLHGFVLQRIKDEEVTKELVDGFRRSWRS